MSWADDICKKHESFVHVGPNCIMCAEDIASKPDWQPIETAPRDGSQVLGWHPSWMNPLVIYWYTGLNRWNTVMQPTCWMPLPDPPTDPQPSAPD